jgi:RNase H-fold protein (predicted Holliday junction resolvase)
MEETVLAVDPGKDKVGLAVVSSARGLLMRAIEQRKTFADVDTIVVGDRTASHEVVESLRDITRLPIVTVDEHRSSMEGRELYLRENPGRGLCRWLPIGLRVPDRPYDDYVAQVLASRYFRSKLGRKE